MIQLHLLLNDISEVLTLFSFSGNAKPGAASFVYKYFTKSQATTVTVN